MKRYFKVYVTEVDSYDEQIVGYHYGMNVNATKLYKEIYAETFNNGKYDSCGYSEIKRIEYLKATTKSEYKKIQPLQKEFLEALWFQVSMRNKNIPYEEECLLSTVIMEDNYNVLDSVLLNKMLEKYKN